MAENKSSRLYAHSPQVINDFSMYEATIAKADAQRKKYIREGSAAGRKQSTDNFKSKDST